MKPQTVSIGITPPPFYQDHHVGGRAVFPAVEAMEQMAATLHDRFPEMKTRQLSNLRFNRFLIMKNRATTAALCQLQPADDESLRATLTTRFTSKAGIGRTLEHAALTVGGLPDHPVSPDMEAVASLEGVCTPVGPELIYSKMVPFGPAYANIRSLLLSADGALARVGSPTPADPRQHLHLGSPYVLDAAFHAACVWSQRYGNTVAFPVGIQHRVVLCPTRLDREYIARVTPRQFETEPFLFDIYIYEESGDLCEAVLGVDMRDVSGGRNRPPEGFYQPADDPLAPLARRGQDLVLMERNALAPFAATALTGSEHQRLAPMTPRRADGFLTARMALKRLARRLSVAPDDRRADEIETVANDGQKPQCLLASGHRPFCSVAHDDRFTIAVAGSQPLGVDVEPLADKALNSAHLFLEADEQKLLDAPGLDRAATALRAWSAKEAATKALDMDLATIWGHVRMTAIEEKESRLETADGRRLTARHALLEDHMVTLLVVERAHG